MEEDEELEELEEQEEQVEQVEVEVEEQEEQEQEDQEEQVEVIPVEEIIETSVPDMADSDEELIADSKETVDEVIPVEEIIDTGTVIPEGDTLSEVDDERKQQDVIDMITAAGDSGGGDVSIEPVEEIIEEEPVVITEDEEIQGEIESKLRLDERIHQLDSQNEDEDDSQEDKDVPISVLLNNYYSR